MTYLELRDLLTEDLVVLSRGSGSHGLRFRGLGILILHVDARGRIIARAFSWDRGLRMRAPTLAVG